MVLKQFKLNILILFMRFTESREITAVLLTATKNFYVGIHSGIYESIKF